MNLIEEVATFLQTNEIGIIATDIFLTNLPDKDGSIIAVIDTGSMNADVDIPVRHPTFQILIRADDYETGKTKLDAIFRVLHGIKNQTIVNGGKKYFHILAMTEGGCIGQDEVGKYEFSINFRCQYPE